MKNIFLSFQYTNISKNKLKNITTIQLKLEELGYNVFCSLDYLGIFYRQEMSVKQRNDFCKNSIKKYDLFFAVIQDKYKSNGMLIESKEAEKLEMPYLLEIKKELYFPKFEKVAQEIHRYDFTDEIIARLPNLSNSQLFEKKIKKN